MIVSTDEGEAVLKARGNLAGDVALAFDLVGTELARWMGLTTPDFALLSLTDIPREWCREFIIENGAAFLSRYVDASTYDASDVFLEKLARPADLSRLVVFDTWIRNVDRYPPEGGFAPQPQNLDNLLFARSAGTRSLKYDLIIIDHTHAFTSSGLETLADPGLVEDAGIYGLFPEFRPYMTRDAVRQAAEKLKTVDAAFVADLMRSIPREWELTTADKNALGALICARASFVAETIENEIFDQQTLRFERRDE